MEAAAAPQLSLEEAMRLAESQDCKDVLVHGCKIESPQVKEEDLPKPKPRGRPKKARVEETKEYQDILEAIVVEPQSRAAKPEPAEPTPFEKAVCQLLNQHPIDVLASGILLGLAAAVVGYYGFRLLRGAFAPVAEAPVPLDEAYDIVLVPLAQ